MKQIFNIDNAFIATLSSGLGNTYTHKGGDMAFTSDTDTLKVSTKTISTCILNATTIIDRALGDGYAIRNPRLLESTANLIYVEYCNLKLSMNEALDGGAKQ